MGYKYWLDCALYFSIATRIQQQNMTLITVAILIALLAVSNGKYINSVSRFEALTAVQVLNNKYIQYLHTKFKVLSHCKLIKWSSFV